jgi:hypothetical protein
MRLVAGRMTPGERMRRMEAMQDAAWAILNERPEAFQQFWRRNVRQRLPRQYPALHFAPQPAI